VRQAVSLALNRTFLAKQETQGIAPPWGNWLSAEEGDALRGDAAQLAAGRPILADAEDAERFALDGRRVWIANPIDAFDRADQQLYLNWLEGKPAGDALLRRSNVVVVQVRSKAQRRLAGNRAFREVERDSAAVLYTRAR